MWIAIQQKGKFWTSIDRNFSAAAGEYLVLGELLKRQHQAYLALGPTQPDWDIVIFGGSNPVKIQVKAIDWPCSKNKAVNVKPPIRFNYLVIVLLERQNSRSRYLILSKREVEEHLSKENLKRKDPKRTITISKTTLEKNEKNWEDKWDVLRS